MSKPMNCKGCGRITWMAKDDLCYSCFEMSQRIPWVFWILTPLVLLFILYWSLP